MHLTREESHQDHRHKGQIEIQRHKLNGKKRKWWLRRGRDQRARERWVNGKDQKLGLRF